MNRLAFSRVVAFAAVSAGSALAGATPAHNVCVPYALGVPTRNQPPKWVAWAGSSGDVDTGLDDPRWQGAVGHSFGLGAAKAPLQMRALWSDRGGDYLYMSFIMDLEGLATAGTEAPRDLFLGFHRAAAYDPGTPAVPEDDEYGYIFQFHLKTGDSAALVEPVHCARPVDSVPGTTHDGCSEAASTPKDYWALFVDNNQPGTCAGAAREFTPMHGAGLSAPLTWMSDQQAVRYWKISTANRWAIQLRLPLVNAGRPITEGIDRTSTFWYQATAQTTAGNFSNVGWWPRESSPSLCYSTAGGGVIDQQALADPDHYSRMKLLTTDPADRSGCDGGIRIETAGIGALADYTGDAAAAAAESLSGDVFFKAVRPDGVTPVVNTVIAQIQNTSSAIINQPLMARFRLALWGSTSWTDSKWLDMRSTIPTTAGQQPGICLGNSDPNAADTCNPSVSLAPGGKAAFTFHWTIGDATATGGIGASEYCKFGLSPPAAVGTCGACSCTGAGAQCDLSTDTGTRSSRGSSTTSFWPCVSAYRDHQCMLVELTAPGGPTAGNVNFEQQSAWNNMNFGQMSVLAREALIDARALPTKPGQQQQDIYLIAMARNMPAVIPGGATSGATYVREQTLARAETIAAPYLQDLDQRPPGQIAEIAAKLRQSATHITLEHATRIAAAASTNEDAKRFRERVQRVARALQIMPEPDAKRVTALLQLVLANKNAEDLSKAVVAAVGPVEAAGIVPTLEIYPFYQPLGEGHGYLPMTAFTVFLSHEGAMTGMTWLIDGATKVGENMYHLQLPVGFARRIQVRAQAIESTNELTPQNASWPCAGGCACGGGAQRRCGLLSVVGNTAPGLIAGVLVIRRRKKRPGKTAA